LLVSGRFAHRRRLSEPGISLFRSVLVYAGGHRLREAPSFVARYARVQEEITTHACRFCLPVTILEMRALTAVQLVLDAIRHLALCFQRGQILAVLRVRVLVPIRFDLGRVLQVLGRLPDP